MRARVLIVLLAVAAVLWCTRTPPPPPCPPVVGEPCRCLPQDAGAADDLAPQLDACARALLRCEMAERLRVRNNAP